MSDARGTLCSPGAVIVAIDASTSFGSVAVLRDCHVVGERDALMKGRHEECLMPAVMEALSDSRCAASDVAHVVCGAGPGSFTSLRIAAAIAKGIAMVTGALLYEVSSLALLVAGQKAPLVPGRYLALLEAMRAERHASLFELDARGLVTEVERLGRIPAAGIPALCERLDARAIGLGSLLEAAPHARGVARLVGAIDSVGPVALDAWEPSYGRLAEAQVRWEAVHGRELSA